MNPVIKDLINKSIRKLEEVNKMKHLKQIRLGLILVSVIVLSSLLYAGIPENPVPEKPALNKARLFNDFSVFSEEKLAVIEDNLILGIKSDNSGLQTSCAYFLGEMKSNNAMIPLLKLARLGKTEEARIVAGLSLYKIHSKIGMYQLKRLSKSDKSELVRKVFDRIYKKYLCDNCRFKEL